MNSRLVPYDLDFRKLNISRNVEKWFLISTLVFSFVLNLVNEFTFSLNELILDSLYIITIISTIIYASLSVINDYILFPSCENKRRTKFIDSSFHSNLSLTDIDPNFYNPELGSGLYKFAVNGFENCFFTYNICKKMAPRKIALNSIIVLIFLIFAYYGLKNSLLIAFVFLQLLISSLFLSDLIRFLIYQNRNYQYLDKYNIFFNRIGSNLDLNTVPEILKYVLDYECNLNWAMISLNSNIYNQEVDKLNTEWIKIKEKFGISNSNSITTK